MTSKEDGALHVIRHVGLERVLILGVLGALVCTAVLQTDAGASATNRTWQALIGNVRSSGSNGTATLVAFWTGAGTLELHLIGLAPSASYALVLIRGPAMATGTSWSSRGWHCADLSDGTLVRLPAIRASSRGTVTRPIALSTGQMTRLLAVPRKIALTVGVGSVARCGSFALQATAKPTPGPSATPAPIPNPTPVASQTCAPWPPAIREVLADLTTPEGLCLIVYTDPSQAPQIDRGLYVPWNPPIVQYVVEPPGGNEFYVLAHEVCHAHQDRVARDAGLPPLEGWYRTPAGTDFIRSTGWSYRGGRWVASEPTKYDNPLEDDADTCAIWFDATQGPRWLRRWAPSRFAWAQRWLPLPNFITPWQSPASPPD